jgi:hypothetical protein
MTRRFFLLVPVGAAATEDPINTGNEVSSACEEMDEAFLAWGAIWNRRQYATRDFGEKLAWDRYQRAAKKCKQAHDRWERGY